MGRGLHAETREAGTETSNAQVGRGHHVDEGEGAIPGVGTSRWYDGGEGADIGGRGADIKVGKAEV